MKKHILFILLPLLALMTTSAIAQNPYLPLWEYVPDGEPRVFEDPDKPGEYRVYIYGSHDTELVRHCGRDQVVWSAPVDDLSAWRYDGVIFKSLYDRDGNLLDKDGIGDRLFAPEVVARRGKDGKMEYIMFPYPCDKNWDRISTVAKSSRPDGPFVVCNWSEDDPRRTVGVIGADPACLIDDDGRVYGYWGGIRSFGAELDPETMCTVKDGCHVIEDLVSGCEQEGIFRFYEASSIRKIEDKYVLIYSRYTRDGEFGLPAASYTLAYAYSDSPLGPFTYGGTLIDGRARDVDTDGNPICTAFPFGNTHGSLCEIDGKWWLFYHRQTGKFFCRQGMVARVDVKVEKGKGGRVIIGEAEYNSEGFREEGLDPLSVSAAGWACYLTNPHGIGYGEYEFFFSGSYIDPTRFDAGSYAAPFNFKQPFCPVVNNTSGSVVGYKYFNFNRTAKASHIEFMAHIKADGNPGTVTLMLDAPSEIQGGRPVASFEVGALKSERMVEVRTNADALKKVKGKHALFFVFDSAVKDKSICEFYDFRFEIKE